MEKKNRYFEDPEFYEAKKAYYKENRERILERQKAYYQRNKERISDYYYEYYNRNKERINDYRRAKRNKEPMQKFKIGKIDKIKICFD